MAHYKLRLAYTSSGVQQVTENVCRVSGLQSSGGWVLILALNSQAEFQQTFHPAFLKWRKFKAHRLPFKEVLTQPQGRNHWELKSLPFHKHFKGYHMLWFECEMSPLGPCV